MVWRMITAWPYDQLSGGDSIGCKSRSGSRQLRCFSDDALGSTLGSDCVFLSKNVNVE